MEELRKEMQVLRDNFDALLYYDKKKLDREMYKYLANKHLVKELKKRNLSKEDILDITKLTEEEYEDILKELEEE